MILGVVSALLMVLAIVAGAFYSMMMVAIAYAFSYMVLIVPIFLYFGFYKIFGYTANQIIKFWLPKLLLGVALLLSVYFGMQMYLYLLLGGYLLHLIYNQRNELLKLKEITVRKLKGT